MRSLFVGSDGVRNGWRMAGWLAITSLTLMGLYALRTLLSDATRAFASESALGFIGVLATTWLFLRWEHDTLSARGFALSARTARELGLGIVGGMVAVGIVTLCGWLLGGFHWAWSPNASARTVLMSAGGMLAVGLFEEAFFHGYAFQRAIRGIGPRWAQLLIAALFVLAHPFSGDNPRSIVVIAMINTFLASLIFGACYLRTRNLAVSVGSHMGWNWTLECLGFGVSGHAPTGLWTTVLHGAPGWLTGGSYGLEGSVITFGVLALTCAALMRWKHPREEVSAPASTPVQPAL
ncbi:CPBP family intramembrane metalloprotease [Corallococcus sp. M34]|uniref:CPBP family intramembrane glutamic endopeptidase n=1 Tax=Citreicoccus inhibens TaxID=2849499 RepID=UPI001C23A06A|nr:type II CAAX endopeptidase family protein [Citreicoccus inhibens]MBU8896857.1 CPBP family intramembrane metalloprotease [Citreicoccus inhibens]